MSVTTSTSFGTGWAEWFCPVNFVLAYVAKSANPQLTGYNTGLLMALMSPENLASAPINQGAIGNSNQIRIGYRKRILSSAVVRTKMTACDTQDVTPLEELNFSLDKYATSGWKVQMNDFYTFCNEFSVALPNINAILRREQRQEITTVANLNNIFASQTALTELIRMMPGTLANIHDLVMIQNAIRNDINQQLAIELYNSFIGNFAGPAPIAASPLSVDVITAANGSLIQKGFQDMLFQYRKAQQQGMPFLVGFNLLQRALSSLTDYCCNLTGSELDPNRTVTGLGMKYYADQHVNEVASGATSTESFVMFAPGALAVYFRNEFGQPTKVGNVHRGTIPDVQMPGLVYDYIANEDGCDNSITFQLGTQFGLWGMRPADTYNVGDNLANVNGVFELTAVEV